MTLLCKIYCIINVTRISGLDNMIALGLFNKFVDTIIKNVYI